MKKHALPLVMTVSATIQFYSTVATALPSKRLNLINMTSNKAAAIPNELKSCALETTEQRYPANEWLHTYTDGSYLSEKIEPERGGSVGCLRAHWLLEKAEAVAPFRLTTGHDFLGVYLHWLGLAAVEACPLCGYARMDDDHLLQCTGLDDYPTDDIVSWYGRLDVKWPRSQARAYDK
ncbi:reverse transcriptase [Trichonephila clavipes]|nr:reverse transcriptase [Trichonephila clavipes]